MQFDLAVCTLYFLFLSEITIFAVQQKVYSKTTHMINYLISIIVAFGFWNKLSKDQKHKISNASWIRTFIYFVLSFAIAVFYFKTNEIATIKEGITISGYRGSFNPENECEDSVIMEINNRFDRDRNRKFIEIGNFLGIPETSRYKQDGSIVTTFLLKNDSSDLIRKFDTIKPSLFEGYESCDGHLYDLTITTNYIPSISPIKEEIIYEDTVLFSDKYLFIKDFETFSMTRSKEVGEFELKGTEDYYGPNSFSLKAKIGSSHLGNINKDTVLLKNQVAFFSNALNNLNFFSAADLSQISYEIGIASDCPLKSVVLRFDVPIEMLPSQYNPNLIDAYQIGFSDSPSLKEMNNRVTLLHLRMPTQENLQLIRSLILTTLLTALLSAAFANLFYCIRRCNAKAKLIKKDKRMNYQQAKKFYKFWIIPHRVTILLVFIGIIYLSYRVYINKPFYFNYETILYSTIIICLIGVILSVLSVLSLRRLLSNKYRRNEEIIDSEERPLDTPLMPVYEGDPKEEMEKTANQEINKESGKNKKEVEDYSPKSPHDIPLIFLRERDPEEEWNKHVSWELYKEKGYEENVSENEENSEENLDL